MSEKKEKKLAELRGGEVTVAAARWGMLDLSNARSASVPPRLGTASGLRQASRSVPRESRFKLFWGPDNLGLGLVSFRFSSSFCDLTAIC
jgi:hypothetical protein